MDWAALTCDMQVKHDTWQFGVSETKGGLADGLHLASLRMNREPGPDVALKLLRGMMRIRLIEERIKHLYAEQEMRCPTHFSIGQEAVAVGVCAHLTREELVTSAHRSHAHYLAKGGDLKAMLAELYGKTTGCASGKGGSMHLIDLSVGFLGAVPIVGSTIPIGVGAAMSSVIQGERCLTVIFFGDGATEAGVFHESLNFAAIHKLPVVMVCENNRYSVLTSLEWRHPRGREIVELARGHGVLGRQGDGNDADAVYDLAGEAIDLPRLVIERCRASASAIERLRRNFVQVSIE